MTRRELIAELGAVVIAGRPRQTVSPPPPRLVPTVSGPLGAHRLGLTLMHEHVLVDFIGADQVSPSRYDVNPLVVQGPGAGPQVTAAGVFADVLRVCAYLGAKI